MKFSIYLPLTLVSKFILSHMRDFVAFSTISENIGNLSSFREKRLYFGLKSVWAVKTMQGIYHEIYLCFDCTGLMMNVCLYTQFK